MIIEIRSLTRRFGSLTAVDSLSLSIEAGEVFGLLGTNGAGKTVTVKMLTTLLPPSSGEAFVDGFNVTREAGLVRRRIGYVPQMLSADGTLTGFENLLVFSELYDVPRRERKRRIEDALEFMGLTDVRGKLVRHYSGGMVRRLEIAQSILHRPRVLFLDEPTVGLDPLGRRLVWELLEKLRSDYGTTIFLTTHLMDEADRLSSRIAILAGGKVVAQGTPAELKRAIGVEGATLDDVFIHYTGGQIGPGGTFFEASRTREAERRHG